MNFFFNKDNKNDMVNMPVFGKLHRWRVCCISYILISMLVLVLFLEFITGGWQGLFEASLIIGIGYILGRWIL